MLVLGCLKGQMRRLERERERGANVFLPFSPLCFPLFTQTNSRQQRQDLQELISTSEGFQTYLGNVVTATLTAVKVQPMVTFLLSVTSESSRFMGQRSHPPPLLVLSVFVTVVDIKPGWRQISDPPPDEMTNRHLRFQRPFQGSNFMLDR